MSERKNKTDLQLLNEVRNGDNDSLNELIVKYRGFVEHIALKYIASPLEKDDLIQEGMIGLLAAAKSYNPEKGAIFPTYASRCVNNSIQSAIKKVSRLKDIPPESIVALDDSVLETQTVLSAEDEYLAKESVSSFTDFIYEELSAFENEVLKLTILGFSQSQTAKKLGKNEKSIDNAIQRIRKKLFGVTF